MSGLDFGMRIGLVSGLDFGMRIGLVSGLNFGIRIGLVSGFLWFKKKYGVSRVRVRVRLMVGGRVSVRVTLVHKDTWSVYGQSYV